MEEYHDISLRFDIVVSVKANSKVEAEKQISYLSNSELFAMVKEQSVFFDGKHKEGSTH